MQTPPHQRCSQSGSPAAGSRRHMMSSCHACDGSSWCWAFNYQVGNAACAACERVSVCHPEDVDADHSECLACDEYLICRGGKATGGNCLFSQQPACSCA